MTNSVVPVRVFDLVGPLCVSMSDGQRIYESIFPLLQQGSRVVLVFDRVEILISAFLNAAIGQLYGKLDADLVDKLLSCRGLDDEDLEFFEYVVENAKYYFERPEQHERAWTEELND